jgi:hypothetical protein
VVAKLNLSNFYRLQVALLMVLVLGGCGDAYGSGRTSHAGSSKTSQAERAAVPAQLVGRWIGGLDKAGHYYYEFYPDGTYRTRPADRGNPRLITGTVEVTPSRITLSNNGSPITVEWHISRSFLFLDEDSYVRLGLIPCA